MNTRARMTARDVLGSFWDGSLPVRPVALSTAMGIKVFKKPDLDVSGEVSLGADGDIVIVYRDTEPQTRQRFTIAHEMGHVVLGHLEHGRKMFRDPIENMFASTRDTREVEANRFAARLLMPDDAVRLAVREGVRTIGELAALFFVSEIAMKFRLKNLGILRG